MRKMFTSRTSRRRSSAGSRVPGPLSRKPLTWDIQSGEHLARVVVNGELDAGTMPGLSEQLESLADSGSHLILDLAGLRFCDCAGLTLFLRMERRARAAGGSLQLAAPTAPVRRLLTLTRLSGVIPVTLGPAVAAAALDGDGHHRQAVSHPSSPARSSPAPG
jgi:anti-anti-sigma factor